MSAINFNATSDIINKLEPAFRELGPHQFSRAVKSAAKRASTAASKTATKEIPTQWTVKKPFVRNTIKAREASGAWEIYSRGKRLSSLSFATKPKLGADTTGNKRKPVFMQTTAGKAPVFVPRSWVWSRHGGVHLARKKNNSLGPRGGKLMEIKGPAVPQMLSSEKVIEPVVETMVETFEKRLIHEYEYRLAKSMKG